ncbi:cell division protein FtsW [Cohnella xylanilytica]|uniref:FtsW/RodA/SpoVE family cell cycle protein n=1 Tax=Cohnella xylanilytica TaxID=557555 RepID=UPI001B26B0F4|nr:FtsW/RodA/SpoVE family cell cycle protein [Cohnella xylanilytica]GIO10477.1 cell division protein FtsW [Cohnella xylanilytica]
MNDIRNREDVRQYLDEICGQVRTREKHDEIRRELASHLEDLVADKLDSLGEAVEDGTDRRVREDEAVREAIRQMGDARLIGKRLNRVHKPKTDWSLVALSAILIGIGLFAMYTVQGAFEPGSHYDSVRFLMNKIVFSALGLAAMAALYFLDYRKLRSLVWPLYITAALLMLLTHFETFGGSVINGSHTWIRIAGISIDTTAVAPYLFAIAYSGYLISGGPGSTGGRYGKLRGYAKELALYFVVPAYLYLKSPSLISLLVHVVAMSIVLLFTRGGWKRWAGYVGVGVVFLSSPLVTATGLYTSYRSQLQTYLQFFDDPDISFSRASYSLRIIRSAGLWGQGFSEFPIRWLPFAQSENIVAFLVYGLGWIVGALLAVIVVFFILRSTRIASQAKDPFARLLVLGMASILSIKLAWSLLMSVGLLPYVGITLPFIGYNGFNTVVELAAMGVILGVYRRKDSIRHASGERTPEAA